MKLYFVLVLLLAVYAMVCESKPTGRRKKKTKYSRTSSKSAKKKKSEVIIATINTNNVLQQPVSEELIIKVLRALGEAIGSAFDQNRRKLEDSELGTNSSVFTTTNGNESTPPITIETAQYALTCEVKVCYLATISFLIVQSLGLGTFTFSTEDLKVEIQEDVDIVSSSSPSWDESIVGSFVVSTPSRRPSQTIILKPSPVPSSDPSALPSLLPTLRPSSTTSNIPSGIPSSDPSSDPSALPSSLPTLRPSSTTSNIPSSVPSSDPSSDPSALPSSLPTFRPSSTTSNIPSGIPSSDPSSDPSELPSLPPVQPT